MYELLEKVNSPADLRQLPRKDLKQLCREIRQYMVECCAVNPGHLASSLGSVEIITALHYTFDTPQDKIVFDVGHQAYAHKILTGRREIFRRNRTSDGISGFPLRGESEYDVFGAGHSSTSISAALGLAEAARMLGREEKVVALIGDGALTGGLAFEGMNNAGAGNADLLIILNDNDQSIDVNTGAFHNYLLKITTDPTYNKIKTHIWDTVGEGRFRELMQRMTRDTKSNLVRKSGGAFFEALGFRYFGPVDGNDIDLMVETLTKLRNIKGPRILHVHTVKGKGYRPAEEDPRIWHAPGKFNPENGERIVEEKPADRYQDVFGAVLCDLARSDGRVVGITPAMASGCGMSAFAEEFPDRFFDVGIEEEHAVTFSAGLAAGGMRPFCNIYSSFSQRAYDQIIHDVALQGLPVVLCLDRAGLVGEDGPTHHGAFDLPAYRAVPGTTIASPRNELQLKNLMFTALQGDGPFIIRYPRGCGEGVQWKDAPYGLLPPGKGEKLLDGERAAILCLGPCACRAVEAALAFRGEYGWNPAVYDLIYLKPADRDILSEAAETGRILTVEEGSLKGGLYGAVCEFVARNAPGTRVEGLGIPDIFIKQDSHSGQLASCGLDTPGIVRALKELMKNS